MATNNKNPITYVQNQISGLSKALAEKGTPGIILLAIIFISIWTPVSLLLWWFFSFLGTAKDFQTAFLNGSLTVTIIAVVLCVVYFAVACFLTIKIIRAMIPTIKAEAEAAKILQDAFGGRVATSTGTILTLPGDKVSARTRTKNIMEALLSRAKSVFKVERVRTNIFTLNEDGMLTILNNDFHLGMLAMSHKGELTIKVPNGYLTVGRAFKYYRPVLSIKDDKGHWPYADYKDGKSVCKEELEKCHPGLQWIISMPIPCKIRPFKIVGGVLSIDSLDSVPGVEQMRQLLPDMSTAAALIAVLNRSTGFLKGVYMTPSVLDPKARSIFKEFLIDPDDFDPASCPEPSREFVRDLAHVQGLEFFGQISEIEIANYLRNELLV